MPAVWLAAVDRRLMGCRPHTQWLAVAAVAVALACLCLSYVPRAYLDYAKVPLLRDLAQPDEYGTDTIADMYEAKVVLHDWRDMYTKDGVSQTPLEARTWSKEASAPYPPAALLIEAAIYWIGERTGIGFYGLILALAATFLGQAAWYCLRTRWYVFALLGVCGLYFGYRFTYVQDCTYLIMLGLVMTALTVARRRPEATHLLMALAIAAKVSPLYYAANLVRMRRVTAVAFVAVLVAAFVLPYFVLPNYLYIFSFQNELKGGWWQTVGGVAVGVPFAMLLSYVAVRRDFDLEDWVGWGLVPIAMVLDIDARWVHFAIPDRLRNQRAARADHICFDSLQWESVADPGDDVVRRSRANWFVRPETVHGESIEPEWIAVVDERANRNSRCQLRNGASMVRVEMGNEQVVDPLDTGLLEGIQDPLSIPAQRGAFWRWRSAALAADRIAGVDQHRFAGGSHHQRGLTAFDVDEVDDEITAGEGTH